MRRRNVLKLRLQTLVAGIAGKEAGIRVQLCDILFRWLISGNIGSLMIAGRYIISDYFVDACYRVIRNAMPLGEAAGKFVIRTVPDHKNRKIFFHNTNNR